MYGFQRNRASAGYDRTHVFQAGWLYELPVGKGKMFVNSGPAAYILGNWKLNGICRPSPALRSPSPPLVHRWLRARTTPRPPTR